VHDKTQAGLQPLIRIEAASATAGDPPAAFALWRMGFRPFYLLASLFAASSVLLWIAQYSGVLTHAYLQGPAWHGHEMLFGFTLAVVAGFLLTAVRNWTGRETPAGYALMALVALWLAARILVLTPYAVAAMIANVAFPLALAVAIGRPLVQSGNRRNYLFIGLLVALSAASLIFHLSQFIVLPWLALPSLHASLDLILFIVAVVGGRVIPMFTNNGVPGAGATRRPWIERAALGGTLLVLAADLLQLPGPAAASLMLVVAAAHACRLWLWKPWRVRHAPLVWILHAAYAWVVAYFVLRGLAEIGLVDRVLSTHALTVGVIGGMTLGMMTRTARGHTGRTLIADPLETASFVLVCLAALLRVFGGIVFPGAYGMAVVASGICWSAAFGLYAALYASVLSRTRIDGKPG